MAQKFARHPDARQKTQRGCAHAHFDPVGNPRAVGGRLASLVESECSLLAESRAGSSCGISPVSNAHWRVAHRPGTLLAVHAESLPRGEDQYLLARAQLCL